ncbi:MAG TPA: hypothetical protein DCE41_34020 [Cytophagales bacterium]|nr:hypothetical protein [Cytophagales bacterium]HAA18446.1 hypothetical protein [Cytophagales bacterium]HAP64201.1 hypothetical protein [Cytophagales bacterium]
MEQGILLHTLLFIDDNDSNLDVLMDYFKDQPYRILFAANGQQGIEVAKAELPDLIISDWAMPLMNGIDLTLKLKATKATRDIPVIIATGVMTNAEDLQEALEAGALEYLRKPFNPLELRARVRAALTLSDTLKESRRKTLEIQSLMDEQMALKKKELAASALMSKEKVQFMMEVKQELGRIGEKLALEDTPEFLKLQRRLTQELEEDRSDEHFLMHFEGMHRGFFTEVRKRTRNLTSNDLNLIAYIKMGMSNREVAQMAGVEVGTVKTNLNRLKKKLELSPDDSLRQYVLNL